MYFLLVIEQMWFGLWRWNHKFFFSGGGKFLSFPILHLSSSIYFFCPASVPFSLYGRLYVPVPCGESGLHHPFLFVLYLFQSIRLETRWQPFHLTGSVSSPSCRSRLVSLSPFQTYSSQYLPVLSKCYCKVFQWDDSKYVYINRGNTLGYILLTPLVVWSLYRLRIFQPHIWNV